MLPSSPPVAWLSPPATMIHAWQLCAPTLLTFRSTHLSSGLTDPVGAVPAEQAGA